MRILKHVALVFLAYAALRMGKRLLDDVRAEREPAEWTAAGREALRVRVLRELEPVGVAATGEGQAALAACMEDRITVRYPGGPRELASDRDAKATVGALAADCVRDVARAILAAPNWAAPFEPLYVEECVRTQGELFRPWCGCIARTAPAHFASPAAFVKADSSADGDRLPAAERDKLQRTGQACSFLWPAGAAPR